MLCVTRAAPPPPRHLRTVSLSLRASLAGPPSSMDGICPTGGSWTWGSAPPFSSSSPSPASRSSSSSSLSRLGNSAANAQVQRKAGRGGDYLGRRDTKCHMQGTSSNTVSLSRKGTRGTTITRKQKATNTTRNTMITAQNPTTNRGGSTDPVPTTAKAATVASPTAAATIAAVNHSLGGKKTSDTRLKQPRIEAPSHLVMDRCHSTSHPRTGWTPWRR